jgi:hypothetical protein
MGGKGRTMIGARTAALGRRLLVGRDFNGELDDMAEPFGSLFRRLNTLPLDERQGVLSHFLDGRPDADAIRSALAAAPVDGPLPEDDDDGDEGWGPLRPRSLPAAAPFPVEVFPACLRRYCVEAASALLAPLDFVAATMLAVAGAAIGQSVNLRLKRTWIEAALLYILHVARPGRTNTPAIKTVMGPLAEIDRESRKQSQEAREAWEAAKKAHAKDPDNCPPPGPEPLQLRSVVRDVTRESLVVVLKDNPRGVLADPDEATAWVASFNEYKGKGADRQFWLSNWSSVAVSVNRKGGRESTHVPYPFVSVVGGLPPSMLDSLADERGRDDGFLDRILFCFPDDDAFPPQRWTEAELGEDAERDWAETIRRLHGTPMVHDPETDLDRPFFVGFTSPALTEWKDWYAAHSAESEAFDFPDPQAGPWSKMRAHAARFALILSRLRWACDPTAAADRPGPVTAEDVRGAVALVDYFKSHLSRVMREATGGIGCVDARAILRWIGRKRVTAFAQSDLTRDFPRLRRDPDALDAALAELIERNAIRRRSAPERPEGTRGRRPLPTYDVHPDLMAPENCGNCSESARDRDGGD